jgi:hypothetical protein
VADNLPDPIRLTVVDDRTKETLQQKIQNNTTLFKKFRNYIKLNIAIFLLCSQKMG